MKIKRLVIGSVVGTIVLYLLGTLFWIVLFADFFAGQAGSAMGVDRDAPIVWAVILGTLFYAIMLTLTLEARGTKGIVGGLWVGAVVGVLVWGTADFTLYGVTNLNTLTGTIADTVLEGVRAAISGGIVAAVLGWVGD